MARARLKASIGTAFSRSGQYASVTSAQASGKVITDALNKVLDQFELASEDIMIEALEPTLEFAKHLTPKLTHALVNSAYLEAASFRGKPRVEIGFARGGIPYYAAFVHEMIDIPHKDPTRSKFLQAAVMSDLGEIYKRLGDGYAEFMNG